jgi:Zn-dependent peptidase ImmA (M78 family)
MSEPRLARRDPEKRAIELLTKFRLQNAVPIPVDKIAEAIGAEIREVELDEDLSGMLVRNKDSRIISVQRSHANARKRFTIAHELGHLLMHPGRPYIAETDRPVRLDLRTNTPGYANPREEREANQFAAALLMPATQVHKRWDSLSSRYGRPTEVASRMSTEFDVSSVAMKYRIVNLGIYSDLESLLSAP